MEATTILFIGFILTAIYFASRRGRKKYEEERNFQDELEAYIQSGPDAKPVKLSPYAYKRKKYIMTQAEAGLFQRLERIAGSRYYVFPQIHLSSLLSHSAKRQDWRAALAKIQRKSVDFVLVDRSTLITAYAIELDDSTHDLSVARTERDELVNEIFEDAGVPLVRLRNIHRMTDREIAESISASRL